MGEWLERICPDSLGTLLSQDPWSDFGICWEIWAMRQDGVPRTQPRG